MFVVDQLSRSILKPISLEVDTGECVSIRGPSGSGKSLLLRALADLDPSEGQVMLDNVERGQVPANEWRQKVTYVAADSGWWDESVGSHFDDPDFAAGQLSRFGFANDAMAWPVARLSTGERQRLALLRALVQSPRVLLLDEPTSALDPDVTAKVEGVLREKLDSGVAVVIVTHDSAQADRLADRQYIIKDGALVEDAS